MRRILTLVALWLLFAATGVAAGFAAARFLEDPVASAASRVATERVRQDARQSATAPTSTPSTTSATPRTSTTSPAAGQSPRSTPSPEPRRGTATSSPGPVPAPASGGSTLGIDTVAGYVSGTCASGVIRMSASPKPGWEVSELSAPGRMGEVEFEQAREPEGQISVHAWCDGERPDFVVDDSELDGTDD